MLQGKIFNLLSIEKNFLNIHFRTLIDRFDFKGFSIFQI
jgi:hypothetical protein